MTIEQLAALVLKHTRQVLAAKGLNALAARAHVEVKPGRAYTRIDRGREPDMTGYLMVDNATGEIFGTRGYGRVNKAKRYGTLATAAGYTWGEYSPHRLPKSS